MTRPFNSIISPASPGQTADGRLWYPILFGVQTIGAIVLFWNAVPLYHQILADPAAHEARPENLVWALSSIALMQVGYWISERVRPSPPQFTNALLGHIILFAARMGFVFATSVFGFLFITQRPGFNVPVFRYVVTIVGLFALHCYVQEVERLGRAFVVRERKPCPNIE